MASSQEAFDENEESVEGFFFDFIHISPRPGQQILMEAFQRLCPGIEKSVDGYTVEAGNMSEAAWEYLATHAIPHCKATVPTVFD